MANVQELTPDERWHLNEAEGWLGLGSLKEAEAALSGLPERVELHPEVLSVRWQLLAAQKQWERALEVAVACTKVAPDSPFGWVHRSFCLHELKRTEEARENLLGVLSRFPVDPLMRYNLACYECQLGHLDEALERLLEAFKIGDAKKFREMAFDDPDLKPLVAKIREL